uniref:Uncharacterized protein n=1 Tax=Arundo donax TaxID=35708 RepID=A0A0A9GW49_ARUDO
MSLLTALSGKAQSICILIWAMHLKCLHTYISHKGVGQSQFQMSSST